MLISLHIDTRDTEADVVIADDLDNTIVLAFEASEKAMQFSRELMLLFNQYNI